MKRSQPSVHFEDRGRVCVIQGRDSGPPWKHFINNQAYGVMATDTGAGYGVSPASEGRFINYFNVKDPVGTGRLVYLRNRSTGTLWSLGRVPGLIDHHVATRFGPGWHEIAAECQAIEASLRVYVPEGNFAAEVWELTLRNASEQAVELTFCPYLEFFLSGGLSANDEPEWYTRANYLAAENVLQVEHLLPNLQEEQIIGGFMAPLFPIDGYVLSRAAFLGTGGMACPTAITEDRFQTQGGCRGERMVGVIKKDILLAGGETRCFTLLVGRADAPDQRRALIGALNQPGALEKAKAEIDHYWAGVFDHNQVATPDADFDRWVNVWLKYQQVQTVRSGNGMSANSPLLGYRDMLQHATGLVLIDPPGARAVILEALAHQYASGRAVRQWSRHGRHDTRDYRDSPYWIIPAVVAYLKETGEKSLLDTVVPFLDQGRSTVAERLELTLACLFADRGEHGLSHIGEGDWLDPLTNCGIHGRGESVWLTMALAHALGDMADLYRWLGQQPQTQACEARRATLVQAIETHGWDGQWYRRLYDDQGRAVGGSADGRMFLNAQTWAVLSGCVPPERVAALFEQVDRRLATPFGYHLFMPPYEQWDPGIGNLSILQFHAVYCHGSAFKIHADAIRGDGDAAYRTFKQICPDNPANPCLQSGAEPHIVPNGYKGAGHDDFGAVLYSGFSGTFPWMLRGAIERIVGAQADYAGLRLAPALPRAWGGCRVVRSLRGHRFEITLDDPEHLGSGVCRLEVDGQAIDGAVVPYPDRPSVVRVHGRLHRR